MSNSPFFAASEESRVMPLDPAAASLTLAQQVESRVRALTYGRIRNLTVEEDHGRMVIRGEVPSHHMRQLALQGALELLSSERFSSKITVA
jgi:hypothetical protein